MDEDLIKCPDCSREIPRTSIKKHIFECMKYTPSFYNYAISVSKHLNNNYLQVYSIYNLVYDGLIRFSIRVTKAQE